MNKLLRVLSLVAFVVGKSLATIGLWGALAWVCIREVFTQEIPLHLRVIPFMCGLLALPFYPFFAIGCWLVKVSGVNTEYPYWDADTDGNH
jgi:hypothetical protein